MIFEIKPKEKLVLNYANLKIILLDCERLKKPVTFYTITRSFIDRYTCIDYNNKPFTLDNFTTNGGLIYYKTDRYNWKTFSIDDIVKIEF